MVLSDKTPADVPSIPKIQEALVTMEDKPSSFKGSCEWIGSFEVCLCLDNFYDVPCKIIHISSGSELPNHLDEIIEHINTYGSPIMMGVVGACTSPAALLIVDPHYVGPTVSKEELQANGWVQWKTMDHFMHHTFYNLCLPRLVLGSKT
ncbi:UFSP2-like protein [Mya arenaria]|uniref:UFSP2-like protein n=1 Tax=Mya arenaria TaxID=6604 RepID=A0ABY7EAM1_MYAAR|nr:UFSP2-like protein [Mya arenaria]